MAFFKNFLPRKRTIEDLYSLETLANGTKIEDIPSNVTQIGTPLKATFFNEMQKGNVQSVVVNKLLEFGVEIYEIQSFDGIGDMPVDDDLKIKFIVPSKNEYDNPKIRLNGTDYTLMRGSTSGLVQLKANDLQTNSICNIVHDNLSFIIENGSLIGTETEAGITKYGTEEMTALEGQRLSQILGAEYGGEVQTIETKEMGKAYYDQTTKFLYLCTETNTLNYVDLSKFKVFSNLNLLNEIDDIKTTVIKSIALPGVTELYLERKGDVAILSIDSGTAFDTRIPGQVLFTIPVGWRPSHNIHMALVPGAGQTQTVPVIIKPNGEATFIGTEALSQPKYGSISYFIPK